MNANEKDPEGVWGAVVRALATELKVSAESVCKARSLRGEFGMDSIAIVNVAFVVEEELSIEIEMNEGDNVDSVDDIVAVVNRSVGRGKGL
jgi:acyl carrier protein